MGTGSDPPALRHSNTNGVALDRVPHNAGRTMKKPAVTRREVQRLKPDILGRYHDLVVTNNLTAYEQMLDEYPQVTQDERAELVADFKRVAEMVLQKRWRRPK